MSGGGADDACLFATLDSIKPLIEALECIESPLSKSQDVIITHKSESGLQLSSEKPGILLASVIIPPSSFTSFRCETGNLRIRLNLSLVLDSLNIFNACSDGNSGIQVWVSSGQDVLVMKVVSGECDTQCELRTLTSDTEDTDFEWGRHRVINDAIMRADALRDALFEMKYGDANLAELRMTADEEFELCCPPGVGLCKCVLEGGDVFESFTSDSTQCVVYRVRYLMRCVKALGLSETCRVRINDMGVLNVMCRMGTGRGESCFVQFLIVAQEMDEDSEEEGDG